MEDIYKKADISIRFCGNKNRIKTRLVAHLV